MSRRRRSRYRHILLTPEPQPRQIELKDCEAVAPPNDHRSPLFCPNLISSDGPRFCSLHSREFSESYEIYKDASRRAEELQPRVLEFSRRNERAGFSCLEEVGEALKITDKFISWSKRELEQRRVHTARFYAYVKPDPGHEMRVAKVQKLLDVADTIRDRLRWRQFELEMRVSALRRTRERELGLRGPPPPRQHQQPPRSTPPRPAAAEGDAGEPVVSVSSFMITVSDDDDNSPEFDDSALEETMDEDSDEWLADEFAEWQAARMLRWHSLSTVYECRPHDDAVYALTRDTRISVIV